MLNIMADKFLSGDRPPLEDPWLPFPFKVEVLDPPSLTAGLSIMSVVHSQKSICMKPFG